MDGHVVTSQATQQGQSAIDSVGEASKAVSNPDNLKATSNALALTAAGAAAFGQVEIAGPAALGSLLTGYAAAVQDDNPVQAVAVETVVNVVAKPISLGAKLAGKNFEATAKNIIEAAGQAVENEYKNKVKE